MKKLKYKNIPEEFNQSGVHSFITMDVPNLYGNRKTKFPIGLKIFKEKYTNVDKFRWKLVNFLDATKIQNLFWFHGLAPRIFDVVEVEFNGDVYIAQVTEVLPESERGKLNKDIFEKMQKVRTMYGIRQLSFDPNKHHWYKNYLVDFSQHQFSDDTFVNHLKSELVENAGWGSNPATYQSVPELATKGQRSLDVRLQAYDFDNIDFEGKTVLDYGCSSGQVSRECLRRGAKYVVGLELPGPAKVAFELSTYLGDFNIDYYGDNFRHDNGTDIYEKIKEYTGEDKFDIVLYLSVMQLRKPPYIKDIVGETFYMEGHTADKEHTYRPWLEENFSKVEYLGESRDHSIRPVFRATA